MAYNVNPPHRQPRRSAEPLSTTDRAPLNRQRIARAALALVDREGLTALTMRRLGAELGVEAMSLYKHVAGKEAILDAVRGLLIDEFAGRLPATPTGDWRHDLATIARTYRAVGGDHPVAFGLLARAPGRAYLAGRDLAEAAIGQLVDAGLDRTTAILAQRTVVRFVLGSVLLDETDVRHRSPATPDELLALERERPLVAELVGSMGPSGGDALFEFGLDLLLTGIAARLPSA